VPYKLSDLMKQIDNAMGSLDKPENLQPYRRVKSRLTAVHRDPRYAFMFGGIVVRDNITEIFSQILRIPVDDKPATIIDLSGVPSEIVNAVVAVICRLVFEFAVWSDRAVPILVVCEEAHRYAPRTQDPSFNLSKAALSRIAKEGRKYGVSLCVISQRASKVSTDLISQCNTIFGMRMTNNDDQNFLRGALSEASNGLFSCLPALRNGEAIAVGQGVPIPMRLNFDRLPDHLRPYSRTASFSGGWRDDTHDTGFISEVVKQWRMRVR
jgi:DNA helicase HerA-like ATPase